MKGVVQMEVEKWSGFAEETGRGRTGQGDQDTN